MNEQPFVFSDRTIHRSMQFCSQPMVKIGANQHQACLETSMTIPIDTINLYRYNVVLNFSLSFVHCTQYQLIQIILRTLISYQNLCLGPYPSRKLNCTSGLSFVDPFIHLRLKVEKEKCHVIYGKGPTYSTRNLS